MDEIRFLGRPISVLEEDHLPSKGDILCFLYGYQGNNLNGFKGISSISSSVKTGCRGHGGCVAKEKKCFLYLVTELWQKAGFPLLEDKYIIQTVEGVKVLHLNMIKKSRSEMEKENLNKVMLETVNFAPPNYVERIKCDIFLSPVDKTTKVEVLQDYIGIAATRCIVRNTLVHFQN